METLLDVYVGLLVFLSFFPHAHLNYTTLMKVHPDMNNYNNNNDNKMN